MGAEVPLMVIKQPEKSTGAITKQYNEGKQKK